MRIFVDIAFSVVIGIIGIHAALHAKLPDHPARVQYEITFVFCLLMQAFLLIRCWKEGKTKVTPICRKENEINPYQAPSE